jgi:eukaryotic-like serine/threonine-protein kinase
LAYFRLNYTDPNLDAIGFGFRAKLTNGVEWTSGEFLFTNPGDYGRVSPQTATSPGTVEYPFNLASGTALAYQTDVTAYIFDAAGNRSPEVAIHLT